MQLQYLEGLFLEPEHIRITIEIVKLVALFCPFAKFLPLREIGAGGVFDRVVETGYPKAGSLGWHGMTPV